MLNKNTFYQLFYRRWTAGPAAPAPGYSVFLPVPSDLPVFLAIALDVTARQSARHRRETLVIPDHPTAAFRADFQRATAAWSAGPIRLVEHAPLGRFLTKRINNPGLKHWMQLCTGINACGTTHALLHDADLFLADPDFMDSHYESCRDMAAVCLGADDVWDKWYAQQNIRHLVATWEAMLDVAWVRSFQPWRHRGHDDRLNGQPHMFDTLLLAQCLTDPAKIAKRNCLDTFIHFNYVISTYRWFQRSRAPFEDQHFRLLLIRLLTDAYAAPETPGELPGMPGLLAGIGNPSARVSYAADLTAAHYPEFRGKMRRLLNSPALSAERAAHIAAALAPFDQAFARHAESDAGLPTGISRA